MDANAGKRCIVLLRDSDNHENNLPIGLLKRVFPSKDRLVRKLELRVVNDGRVHQYVHLFEK